MNWPASQAEAWGKRSVGWLQSDGLPSDPDALAHLGIGAAIAVTATQPSGADAGIALGNAARTQPHVLDVWRRVPGERPIWIIERGRAGAVLGDALGQGPLAAGALGMLQWRAIARWQPEPFDVGHAIWPMISYVATRGGYDAIETTIDQLLVAGGRTKETALDSTTTIEFGFQLHRASLEYSAAALGSMAMLDADDGSTVTDTFRRSATVADERVATVSTAVARSVTTDRSSSSTRLESLRSGPRPEIERRNASQNGWSNACGSTRALRSKCSWTGHRRTAPTPELPLKRECFSGRRSAGVAAHQ